MEEDNNIKRNIKVKIVLEQKFNYKKADNYKENKEDKVLNEIQNSYFNIIKNNK